LARNTNIKLRRSATAGAIPTTSNLDLGELALNTYDGKLYAKTTEGSASEVIQVGSTTDSYHKIRKSQTLSFAVTVDTKTTDHAHHGSGSSSGYFIDGLQSPHLHLVPGNTYRFDQSDSSNSGHPLRFWYDAAKNTGYTVGVTTNGTPGNSGAYTQIIPTDTTPLVLHYQCSSHAHMGGRVDFATRNFTGFDTDDLTEGSTNLYFTNARARAAVSVTDAGGDGSLAYNSSTGVITYTGPSAAEVRAHFSAGTGIGISGGTISTSITQYANSDVDSHLNQSNPTSGYVLSWNGSDYAWVSNAGFTTANARTAISVTDAGGDGSLAYNNSTGVITYTGPSAAEVRAHLSAGTGVTYSGGAISIGQAVGTSSNVSFGTISGTVITGSTSIKTPLIEYTDGDDAITIADGGHITTGGNLTVTGNLTVSGTTTTVNSSTLDVADLNITVGKNATTSSATDGAGLTFGAWSSGTIPTLTWNHANSRFAMNKDLATNLVGNVTGNVSGTAATVTGAAQTAITSLGTLTALTVDNITIDGTEIDSTGGLFLDVAGDIVLDADGGDITFKDGGTAIGKFSNNGTNLQINAEVADKDILFTGTDGSTGITALSLDMSDGGSAYFNHDITLNTFSDKLIFGSASNVLTYNQWLMSASGGATIKNVAGPLTLNPDDFTAFQVNDTEKARIDGTGFGIGTTSPAVSLDIGSKTDAIRIPNGTTAQRPTAAAGQFRYNTTTSQFEGYTSSWGAIGGGGDAFGTIAVSGQSNVVADQENDTLTLVAGSGMTISSAAGSDTITFAATSTTSQDAVYKEYVFAPSSSTTTFTGSDANSNTLSYTVGYIKVYLNGILLKPTTDYTATNGSSVVLVNAAGANDTIQISTFVQVVGSGDSSLSELTGDNSTTAFTIAANPNHENNTQVYIDGVYQEKSTYSVSGTTLTFSTAPPSGSSIEVVIGSRNVTVADIEGLTVSNGLTVSSGITTDTLTASGAGSITGNLDIASSLRHIGDTDTELLFGTNEIALKAGGATHFQASSDQTTRIYGGNTAAIVINASQKVGIGSASPAVSLDVGTKTDAIRVPNGTTGDRPTAALGQLRYNTTTSEFEGYADGAWGKIGGGGDSFGTIAVSGQSNVVAEQENDTLTFAAGTGITLTTNASSDTVTITNSATGANAFGNVAVSGQTTIAADSTNDTLTIVGAGGITATTTAGTDTLTLTGQTSINPFTTDLFTTANNSTTAFTLSVTPPSENNLIVFLEGAYQNKNSYTLSGTTLTLDSAPASGSEVVVHIIQNGVVGAGNTVDEFTGNGSTAAYTLSVAPMNENGTFVYLDGVYQEKSTYSVSGTTLTFDTNVTNGHSIEVVTPTVTEINQPATDSINAIGMFDDTTIMGSTVTSTTLTTTSASTIATHAAATYRTIKYIVQLTQGTDYHSTEINLIHDGTTVYISEYGTLFDNAVLGTLSATISSGNVLLQLTPGSNSSLTARVVSTAIPV